MVAVVAALSFVAFALWCSWLVADVRQLRADVTSRVVWLGDTQGLRGEIERAVTEGAPIDEAVVDAYDEALDEMSAQGGLGLVEAVERVERGLPNLSSDPGTALEALGGLTQALRAETGALSATLGSRWNALYVLVLVSLTLGAAVVWALFRGAQSEAVERLRVERSLERALDAMPSLAVLSRGDEVVYANPEALRVLRNEPELLDQLAQAEPGDLRLPRGADDVLLDVTSVEPLRVGGQQGTLVLARDVTRRRALEAQLQLADRLAAVGTIATGVAHEINNPLAYVLANLDFLERVLDGGLQGDDIAEARTILAETRDGAERLRAIVRDLKAFAHDDDTLAEVDVHAVLDAACRMAGTELRHRATVERRYGALPSVLANEGRLGQVFLNLLVNAAHAFDEKPGPSDANRVVLRTSLAADGSAIVEVEDNGPGIDEQALEHIFDPFFTTKDVGVGTGLGLFLVRSTVEDLGGRLSVDTALGRGTTFRVSLPPASNGLRRAG